MRLFAFDLENTLIYNELLPDLARLVGREEEVRRITRLGVEGRIDWEEGFRQRASFLTGVSREDVQKAAADLRLVPGALGFVKSIRGRGHPVGLITGTKGASLRSGLLMTCTESTSTRGSVRGLRTG